MTAELRTATADLLAVAHHLTDDDLARPTPCTGWDVRRLLEHLVGWQRVFAACARDVVPPFADGSPTYVLADGPVSGPGEAARSGPAERVVADLRSSAADLVDALDTRKTAVDLPYRGPTPVGAHVEELVAETLLHNWDLATAVGRDIAPAREVLAVAHRGLTRLRAESFADVAFGPATGGGPDLAGLLARSGR